MTKYILHGGETGRPTEDNKQFFIEMTKGLPDPFTILCIYFARQRDQWDKLLAQDKDRFSSASPKKSLKFICADSDIKIFQEQLQETHVVYMRGGDTDMLLNVLRSIENLNALIKGKVVSGSSAGACALSSYFHTGTHGTTVRNGLGILRIKAFVHYTEEKQNDLEELEKRGEKLPVYKIPEEKFFVIQQ